MRLTQYVYKKDIKEILLGYDDIGRPIWKKETVLVPIKADIEHFSPDKALSELGLRVEPNFKVYVYPNTQLIVGDYVTFKDREFTVIAVLDYRRHIEILIKEGEL